MTNLASLSFAEFDNSVHFGHTTIGNIELVTSTVTINHEFKINDLQHPLFNELLIHEGEKPTLGSWMPVGSVEMLKELLRDARPKSEDVSFHIPI